MVFADAFNLTAEFFQLSACNCDLLDSCFRFVGLFFQLFQFLSRFYDLTLERVILLLGDIPVGESGVCLLRRSLQRFQLFFRLGNGVAQELVLLRQQFRIAGVELQQLFYVLQLGLRVSDFGIDALERGLQLSGVTADFNGDALYSVSHGGASFSAKMKNARTNPSIKKAPAVID